LIINGIGLSRLIIQLWLVWFWFKFKNNVTKQCIYYGLKLYIGENTSQLFYIIVISLV
jgi:hypothetical protein